jgi:hypothetical protein
MPNKIKARAAVAAIVVIAIGFAILNYDPPVPPINAPVPLRELIEKSDLIVYATIGKVERPSAVTSTVTNKWVQKAMGILDAKRKPSGIAHLTVKQTAKGRPVETALVRFPPSVNFPDPAKNPKADRAIAFLTGSLGNYRPVALSFGTKVVRREKADTLLRFISEFVAIEKLPRSEREARRAEWLVRLIEEPSLRWDGAASWIGDNANPGEALKKLSPKLIERVEAVAFRDEPLAFGDDLLLRELAATRPRPVIRRVLRYLELASRKPANDTDAVFEEPWRCLGAVELLIQVAGMPPEFRERFRTASYPNLASSPSRAEFIDTYLPRIKARLKELALVD